MAEYWVPSTHHEGVGSHPPSLVPIQLRHPVQAHLESKWLVENEAYFGLLREGQARGLRRVSPSSTPPEHHTNCRSLRSDVVRPASGKGRWGRRTKCTSQSCSLLPFQSPIRLERIFRLFFTVCLMKCKSKIEKNFWRVWILFVCGIQKAYGAFRFTSV